MLKSVQVSNICSFDLASRVMHKNVQNESTRFGAYLRSLRLQRKFDNISAYIREYKPPISVSFYRDLERGRRLPSISSAVHICRSLQADTHGFFYYLLSDLIPESAHGILRTPHKTVSEELVPNPFKIGNFARVNSNELTIFSIESAEYFSRDLRLLQLIDLIYFNEKNGITYDALDRARKQLGLQVDLSKLISDFLAQELIQVDSDNQDHVYPLSRYYAINLADKHHRKIGKRRLQSKIFKTIQTIRTHANSKDQLMILQYHVGYIQKSQFYDFVSKLAECMLISRYSKAELSTGCPAYNVNLIMSFIPGFNVI